jgi:hypothetical protein
MSFLGLGRTAEERSATDDYRRLLDDMAGGRVALAGLASRLAAAGAATGLKPRKLTKLHDQTFRALAERVLADDLLTKAEEDELLRVGELLGVPNGNIQARFPDLVIRLMIAGINDGRMPVESRPSMRPKTREVVHAEFAAALMKEVVRREYRGGSSGISIPIGFGMRYSTSSTRGRSVVVGVELQAADAGVLAITSERVVFIGQRKTQESQYRKLVGMDVFTDGVRLSVSNRQTPSLFKVPSGDLVAAMINRAARNHG